MTNTNLNICLIGGAGYIGIELAKELSNLSSVGKVTIYDNLQRGNFNAFCGSRDCVADKMLLIDADVLNTRRLKQVLGSADVVVNLAAAVPSKQAFTAPHVFEQINNWGAANVVDVFREVCPTSKLLHLSSLNIFGSGTFQSLDAPVPTDPYGLSKLRGESHILMAREEFGLQCSVIRCPSVFGYSDNLRLDSLLNRMVFDANFLGKIVIPGDIEAFSPHCYIDVLVQQLSSLITDDMSDSVIFARCSNVSAQMLLEVLDRLIDGLESTYIDANQYRQHLTFSEDLDFVVPVDTQVLTKQTQDFLSKFSFKLSRKS